MIFLPHTGFPRRGENRRCADMRMNRTLKIRIFFSASKIIDLFIEAPFFQKKSFNYSIRIWF
jgi:hypothetical protein